MGKTCAVLDCSGGKEQGRGKQSFYQFPSTGKTKSSWLKFLHVANSKWIWQPTDIMYVCGIHFETKFLHSGYAGKTRVAETGFPTLLNDRIVEEMQTEHLLYEVSSTVVQLGETDLCPATRVLQLEEEIKTKDDIIRQLQQQLQSSRTRLTQARTSLKTANQKLKRQEQTKKRKTIETEDQSSKHCKIDNENLNAAIEERVKSVELKAIIKRSINGKPNSPYCETLKEFCYRLHYYAGKGYEMLRDHFGGVIPSVRSFRSWTDHIKIKPGFLKESLTFLKKINDESSKKMYYALSLDEMYIRKQIIHQGDGFVGYVDYGDITTVDSENYNKMATAALFVLATSINGKKKIPICYILTNGIKSSILAVVIQRSLYEMSRTGSFVTSITFDGLQSNFRAVEMLGACLNVESDKFQPFIKNENLESIKIIPDVCHMMKLFRNLFKVFGVMTNFKGQKVKWVHIERLQDLQQSEGLKAANKLTNRHVNFELQKMKTKLCLQVMSNSVAVALSLCRALGISGFEDTHGTEEFLLFLNKLFDILNSKCGGIEDKSPLSPSRMHEVSPFLAMMKFYLLNLVVNDKGKDSFLIHTRKGTAVKGLLIAINSVELLMQDIARPDNDLRYLSTYKLSQDKLELFFGTVRSRFGFNNNPNVVQLASALKSILCMKTQCIVKGNCEDIETDEGTRICAFQNINSILDDNDERILELDSDNFTECLSTLSPFLENVVCYIAGHVGFKLSSKLSCECCIQNMFPTEEDLLKLDGDTLLIKKKSVGGLFVPSYFLFTVCTIAEQLTRKTQEGDLRKLSKDALIESIIGQCKRVNAVCLWRESRNTYLCDHVNDVIRSICSIFLKIRLHHAAKLTSLTSNPCSNRSFYTKSYLFSGN